MSKPIAGIVIRLLDANTSGTMCMDIITKQAIGFGIAMALIFGVASQQVGLAILFGVIFGAGFFAYRKRKSAV